MASFNCNGIGELSDLFDNIAAIPDSLIDDMLNAEAGVAEEAQRSTGEAMGVHKTGVTLSSIKRTKVKSSKGGRVIYVYPQGTNEDGNTNSEVAFINEFGKTGQAARAFIKTANEQCADAAVDAAAKVYDQFINTGG